LAKNKTKTWINFRIYFGGSVLLRLPVTRIYFGGSVLLRLPVTTTALRRRGIQCAFCRNRQPKVEKKVD